MTTTSSLHELARRDPRDIAAELDRAIDLIRQRHQINTEALEAALAPAAKLRRRADDADAEVRRLERRREDLLVPAKLDATSESAKELDGLPSLVAALKQSAIDDRDAAKKLDVSANDPLRIASAESGLQLADAIYRRAVLPTLPCFALFDEALNKMKDGIVEVIKADRLRERAHQSAHGRPSRTEPIEILIAKTLSMRLHDILVEVAPAQRAAVVTTFRKHYPGAPTSLLAQIAALMPEHIGVQQPAEVTH